MVPSISPVHLIDCQTLSNVLVSQQKKLPLERDMILVDVREPSEIESGGKLQGAVNIPFGLSKTDPRLFRAVLSDLNREHWIIFQCRSGRRSDFTALEALDLGFTRVSDLKGGALEWEALGFPLERFKNNHSPWVHSIETNKAKAYIITDLATKEAIILNPGLETGTGTGTGTGVDPMATANKILAFVAEYQLNVKLILDSQNFTPAAYYLKESLEAHPPVGLDSLIQEDNGCTRWKLGQHIDCSAYVASHSTTFMFGDCLFMDQTISTNNVVLSINTRVYARDVVFQGGVMAKPAKDYLKTIDGLLVSGTM
ncbi:Rhodanese-like domain-containing protein [Phycomyces nitens]|nr:Rhodanese-like domain-containing protein [Phycomyces nitens]